MTTKDGGTMLNSPQEWAANFGIELTAWELWVLRTRSAQLDAVNRAGKYRLLLALRPETCPYCQWRVCERSTWTGEIPIPADAPNTGPGYRCPNCEHELVHFQGSTTADRHGMEPTRADPPVVVERVKRGAPLPEDM